MVPDVGKAQKFISDYRSSNVAVLSAEEILHRREVASVNNESLTHPDRLAIGGSISAAISNVVTHSNYTNANRKEALMKDDLIGSTHIMDSLHEKGVYYLIRLPNYQKSWKGKLLK